MEIIFLGLLPLLFMLLAIVMIVVTQISGFVQFRRFSSKERDNSRTISQFMQRMGLASSQLARRGRQLEDLSRRLRLNNDELARLNTMKIKFLSMAVHDVRTPLTAVRGFSDMLARSPLLGPTEKRHLSYITRATDQINLLMGDLTDMALIEAGKYKIEMSAFLLGDMISDITPGIQLLAQAKGLQFHVGEMPGGATLTADRFRLGRVLQNLLGNAVKFTPAGGRVELQGRLSGHCLTLSVKDTGPGIHPSERRKIFEKFYQSRHMKDKTAKAAGWGLGLAIADEIVRGHGGEIGVDSPGIGRGSTFSVKVPLEPRLRLPAPRGARAAAAAALLLCLLAPARARAQSLPLDEKAKFERALEERVEGVLLRILGPNRAKVIIDAELDFSRIEKFETKDGATTASTVRRTPYLWDAPAAGASGAQAEILPGVVAVETRSPEAAAAKPQSYEKLNTFPTDFVKKLSVTVILDKSVETQMSDEIRGILADILAITPVRGDALTIVHAPFAPVWKTIWYSPEMAWMIVKYLLIGMLSLLTLLVVAVSLMRMSDAMKDMAQAQSQHYAMDVRTGGGEVPGEQSLLEGGKIPGEEAAPGSALALPAPGDDVRFQVRPDQIEILSEMVGGEKPDNIALIAAHLAPEMRDLLLQALPAGVSENVLISLGRVRFVEPEVLLNLKEEMERRLAGAVGGIARLVRMIEASDFARRNAMIESISARDPELGQKLRARVFVLESLAGLSETEWSLLLGKVPYEDWSLSLADGPEAVARALIAHLPGNAAKVVGQMIEAKPGDAAARQAAQERLARTVAELVSVGLLSNPASRETERLQPTPQEDPA